MLPELQIFSPVINTFIYAYVPRLTNDFNSNVNLTEEFAWNIFLPIERWQPNNNIELRPYCSLCNTICMSSLCPIIDYWNVFLFCVAKLVCICTWFQRIRWKCGIRRARIGVRCWRWGQKCRREQRLVSRRFLFVYFRLSGLIHPIGFYG